MAKKTAKKQANKGKSKKPQDKAIKAAFSKMESSLLEKLSEEEFLEYKELTSSMLTKHKIFCYFYAESGNATEAAISAGYSAKTAQQSGCRMLSFVKVKEFLGFIYRIFDRDLIADIAEVMKKYTRILRREEMELIPVTLKTKKKYIDENGKRCEEEKERVKIVEVPAKLSDVNHAADSLMKRWGAFKSEVTVNGKVSNDVNLTAGQNVIASLATTMSLDDMAATLKIAQEKLGVDDGDDGQ